ncbi:MAG TPA: hypothetical protein VHG93_00115, partial [Longimicrobium sp.]|nr:hypothetical protein [Longimicrobium sp.]
MLSRVLPIALLLSTGPALAPGAAAQADTTSAAAVLRHYCPGPQVRLASAESVVQGYCGRIEDGRLLVRFGR